MFENALRTLNSLALLLDLYYTTHGRERDRDAKDEGKNRERRKFCTREWSSCIKMTRMDGGGLAYDENNEEKIRLAERAVVRITRTSCVLGTRFRGLSEMHPCGVSSI